jgi:GxxExxY protein
MTRTHVDGITGEVIDCSIGLHRRVGPGLLESFYERILERDLQQRGLIVERQKCVSFEFEGVLFTDAIRVDLLVEGLVLVELKSIEKIHAVHKKQVLTYLRMLRLPVGLLINFGQDTLKEGLHRIAHTYQSLR